MRVTTLQKSPLPTAGEGIMVQTGDMGNTLFHNRSNSYEESCHALEGFEFRL